MTLSLAAFIAVAVLLKPGCQLVSIHVGNDITRMAVIVLLPCLAVGIFGTMIYDLLSYATFRFGYQAGYDEVVMNIGEQGERSASRAMKFLLIYPLMIAVWAAIAVVWLATINCPGHGWAPWIAA